MSTPETPQAGPLRILILAHAVPPQNATAAHRIYSWARTWCDLGHEIHVLTPAKAAFDGSMDLARDMGGIHVHEVPYLLARGGVGPPPQGESLRKVERWDWLKTLTRRIRYSLAMFGDPRLVAYRPLVRRGLALGRGRPFDLIVASSPPEVMFFAARTLSRRLGVPWVADFRDLWFRDMRLHQSRLASWLSGPVNKRLVRSARALVTVSQGLQARLATALGREALVCYNGFFESERSAGAATDPWRDGRRHIVYTGRMYPGKRDPEPLFRALSGLPAVAERICVDFYGFDDPWLRRLIDQYGVTGCVRVRGFVPYRESMRVQRAADVLLFLDWTDASAEGVLTGKLFEYLATGRPILSLGRSKDTEAARLIAQAKGGETLAAEDEISAYLRRLVAAPRPADVRPEGLAAFSRENQARRLIAEIREACALPAGGAR